MINTTGDSMTAEPIITVLLPDAEYNMYVRHMILRTQVRSYRTKEPELCYQYASQWVCTCGARSNLEQVRNIPEFELITKGFVKWPMINLWAQHVRRQHCKGNRSLQL